jgi:hypothetical protein
VLRGLLFTVFQVLVGFDDILDEPVPDDIDL